MTQISDDIHFALQAQYLVKCESDFSWQAQHFVTFWEIAGTRNVVFYNTKSSSENGEAALMIACKVRGDISIPSEVMFPCLMVLSSQKRKVSVRIKIRSVLRLTNRSISLMGVAFDFDIDSEAMFAVR